MMLLVNQKVNKMKKALKTLLTLALTILIGLLAVGCGKKESDISKPEESSNTNESITTSLITNNSSATESTTTDNTNSSTISSTESTTSSNTSSTYSQTNSEFFGRPEFNDTTSQPLPSAPIDTEDTSSDATPSDTVLTSSQEKYTKKAVSTVLDALKNGDFDTAYNSLTGNQPPKESLGFDVATLKKVKSIFSEMDYEIISVKRTDDTKAVVKVKITALNFKKVYKNYVKDASQIAANSPNLTPQEISKKIDKAFSDALKDGKKKPVEETLKITVVGHGKEWKAEYSNDFAKACLGGITQVAEALK